MSNRRDRDRSKSALSKLDALPQVSYEEVAQATYGKSGGEIVEQWFGDVEAAAAGADDVVAGGDGAVYAYDYRLTDIGLDPDTLPADRSSWEQLGKLLFRLDQAMQWLIGDWLLLGEHRNWGKHEEIAEALGYDVKTLYDYRYVARHVPYDMRHENLSFGHHKLVARYESEVQQLWLEAAAKGDYDAASAAAKPWSISRMRREMRGLPAPQASAESPFERDLQRLNRELTRRKWNQLPPEERRRRYQQLRELLLRMKRYGLD